MINHGKILSDGSLQDLRAGFGGQRILTVECDSDQLPVLLPGVTLIARSGRRLRLAFDPRQVPAGALIARLAAELPIRDLALEDPPIEEVVARFYAGAPA